MATEGYRPREGGFFQFAAVTKGGMVFAVKPRDYTQKVNKKLRQLAIRSALSMKVSGDIIVLRI